jgi:hypothetical protein
LNPTIRGATPAPASRIRRSPGFDWPLAAALGFALAVGLALRVYQLDLQILIDDEWHAIAKIATSSYGEISATFGLSDHSIPLTLYYAWVASLGRLSEASMYAPVLASGVALGILAVASVRRFTPALALSAFALLLATSPLLVLYSRQARPYAMTLVLALAAIVCIYRWSRNGDRRYAWSYVVLGSMAMYLHLIVAPAVLGAFPILFVRWCADRRRKASSLFAIAGWGLFTVTVIALLLAPAVSYDWYALRARVSGEPISLPALWRAWLMASGTAWSWLAAACAAMAALGLRRLWVTHGDATRFALALAALQLAAVFASGALWLNHPLVMTRYLLVCLPPLLYAMAVGFDGIATRTLPRWLRLPALVVAVAALFASGPLPSALAYPNSFFAHYIYFFDVDPTENPVIPVLQPGPMPTFYADLSSFPPGSLTLIEAPWRFESIFNRLPYFQHVHRQKVKIGLVGGLCPPGGRGEDTLRFPNRFRNLVDLAEDPDALRLHADYVVFHKRLELPNMAPPWTVAGGTALPSVDRCITAFRAAFGPPVFEDETITAFALVRPQRGF